MSQDLYTLGAISALESGSPQGRADVAQSVYNRLQDGTYGSSITDVLTRKGQYQPAFVDPNASSGPKTEVSPEFRSITDENSAVAAMSSYYRKRGIPKSDNSLRQDLRKSISAIQNAELQQNARDFVGSNTEFLSAGSSAPAGAKWRGSNSDNRFFTAYGSAENRAGQTSPSSVPTVISQGEVGDPEDLSARSADATAASEAATPREKIEIPKPEELSQNVTNAVNEYNAATDAVNKIVEENEGTAYEQWDDETKEKYNEALRQLGEAEDKLKGLASKDAGANCIARETIGKSWSLKESPDCTTIIKTKAYAQALSILQTEVALPDPCGKSDLAKINTELLKFFNTLKEIRKFGDTFINSAFNDIYRIQNLIRNTASIVGAVLKGLMQNLRNWLLDKIRRGIQDLIDMLFPTLAKNLKNTIIGQIIDNVLCAFKGIIGNLGSLVGDFLFELVGKVVNAPLCAVQQFTNGLINNVVALVDDALGPVLDGINDLLSGVGKIAGSIFEAIDFILGFEAYLCQKPNCPEIKAAKLGPWSNNPSKPFGSGFSNFLDNAEKNLSQEGIQGWVDGLSIFGGTLGDLSDAPDAPFPCDTNPFQCGPPSIEIFGGGGIGAVGKAVVNELGQIYGINIENGGAGYSRPPFVSIVDACDNGNYASAYAEIDYNPQSSTYGQVTNIVMVNHGNGYLNEPNGLDEFDNPVDSAQDSSVIGTVPVPGELLDSGVNDYVVCLDGFEIISTGLGYSPLDEIIITPDLPNLEAGVRMTEAGQIFEINLREKVCGLIDIPEITINSDTGEGAKIRPKLSFIKITDDIEEELPPQTIIAVDKTTASDASIASLAQRNVVRVIDCVGNTPPVVGYVNGQPYSGPFHVHPSTGVKMVGAVHISGYHDTIYDTAQDSLNRTRTSIEPSSTTTSTTSTRTPTPTPRSTPRPTPSPAPAPSPSPAPSPAPSPSPSPSPSPGGGGYGGY
jgi:hypothetical protein